MRRAPILTTALLAAAGVALFAGGAAAQSAGGPGSGASTAEARGLRYLSWPSRGEAAPAAPVAAAPAAAVRRDLRRPNTVIPHGGFAAAAPAPARPGLTPAPGARRTLTPANAWMQPAAPPPPPPVAAPPAMPRLQPQPQPRPTPAPRAMPDYLPDPGGRGQAVPAEMIYAPASPPPQGDPSDPMAPRRDAPIFRMQQDAPAAPPTATPAVQPASAAVGTPPEPRRVADVANSGEPPPQQGGRYYSVHRQNGRRPDVLEMPAPTYVDALAVTMPETIASQDLAAPE